MSRWQTAPVERPDAVDANASNIRPKLRPGQRLRGGQRTGAVATVVFKASIKELRRPIFKNAPAGQGSSPT